MASGFVGGVAALIVAGCSGTEPDRPAADVTSAPSPTSAESPSVAPTSAGPAKAIPAGIPDSAFLQESDAPEKAKEKPNRLDSDGNALPAFCKAGYEQKDQVGVRGTELLLIASKDATEGSTPKAAVYENVIVYKGAGATEFMTDLRAAVRGCASQKEDNGVTAKNFLRGSIGAGDDSELIERTRPATDDAGEPIDNQVNQVFWAAVRQGDTIAFVSNGGWESGSAEKSDTVTLATRAATRVKAWRG
ncbi:hypothetical protein [Paractinoplanes durhamensis]|uniref:hypothetical protein n=1 Tax=Paractinoplanes durhamensis TaxID=113563 RepID=UPI001942BBE7|nr:hypothetical protein [Actinoplanes durhamensis]